MSSKARLVITAVVVEKRPVAQVAREYGVSRSWVYELLARYRAEGDGAFRARSRRPKTSPRATPPETIEMVLELRKRLAGQGLDAGPDTIVWHLAHHQGVAISRATVHRILARHSQVVPTPAKRPKSSYLRFEATYPNECWQSDFTHHRLAGGAHVEIITWLDDHSRYALGVTAHHRVTAGIVAATFATAAAAHGFPASTLTDNGMVYTVRLASRRGGRTALEHELARRGITQKNSRPSHPTTCGKVERFQQTLKNWLRAQPHPPATIVELQALLHRFVETYNHQRPHRALAHRATPATAYTARPKAAPGADRTTDTHHRVRTDKIDKSGTVTLRVAGRLRHIGIGRPHSGTHVLLLTQDRHVRVIDAATGELLRELEIDLTRDYQPRHPPTPK
ncbi:IS481 family transposase [Actinomycetospora sp. CA-101289]|uniref:IS481 family transposase n=1 Tax=Actinomycetospora sp. CA-101289 TaxID=3239893 RepID=UPI003D97AF42